MVASTASLSASIPHALTQVFVSSAWVLIWSGCVWAQALEGRLSLGWAQGQHSAALPSSDAGPQLGGTVCWRPMFFSNYTLFSFCPLPLNPSPFVLWFQPFSNSIFCSSQLNFSSAPSLHLSILSPASTCLLFQLESDSICVPWQEHLLCTVPVSL